MKQFLPFNSVHHQIQKLSIPNVIVVLSKLQIDHSSTKLIRDSGGVHQALFHHMSHGTRVYLVDAKLSSPFGGLNDCSINTRKWTINTICDN